MLNDTQDAYGHLLWDYHKGRENVEIVEREDGFISKAEMEDLLDGTAWRVERYIDAADTPTYVAILTKRIHT